MRVMEETVKGARLTVVTARVAARLVALLECGVRDR